MASKIFRSTLLLADIVLLCCLCIIMGVLYGYANDVQVTQLKDELQIAAAGMEEGGTAFLERLSSDRFRITWIGGDGEVLYDTHADASQMANHAERAEIQAALRYGTGSATRKSDTLLERRIYEAKRLSDGSVLRISIRCVWSLPSSLLPFWTNGYPERSPSPWRIWIWKIPCPMIPMRSYPRC